MPVIIDSAADFQRQIAAQIERLLEISRKHFRMAVRQITVYTRAGCHLCADAGALLAKHGLTPEWIDIDTDPQLRERFNTCVPVVMIDGKVRFRGRVNEVLLNRLLGK